MSTTPEITLPTTFDVRALAQAIVACERTLRNPEVDDEQVRFIQAMRMAGLTEAWTLISGGEDAWSELHNCVHAHQFVTAEAIMDREMAEVHAVAESPGYVATLA